MSGMLNYVYHSFTSGVLAISKFSLCTIAAVSWTSVKTSANCSDEDEIFIPTRVHAISKRDVFVQGNRLLYR